MNGPTKKRIIGQPDWMGETWTAAESTGHPSESPVRPVTASPDRKPRPADPAPWQRKDGDSGGPTRPEVDVPDNKQLLKKMRRVDPNQAKRYRQRTGQ